MTQELHREALARQMAGNAGQLPTAPTGPLLDCFKALELAQAIESEVNRAQDRSMTKIVLHITFADALDMAAYLRRAVHMGV